MKLFGLRGSLFSLLLLIAIPLNAQPLQGIVKEGLTISSEVLGEEVRYTMYLPSDYETSHRYYPIVYLLHGYSDDDSGWLQFGEANRIVDEGIANGELPPMIIAMPDGGVSFYINDAEGKVQWEDFFMNEFIPHVEEAFRVRQKKEFRGIAGLSMGGYGALVNGLRHPDMFTAVAAFSSAVWSDEEVLAMEEPQYNAFMAPLFGGQGATGEARLTDHWKAHSILHLVEHGDEEELKSVRYYIDCGDDDFLAVGNSKLHIAMLQREIPHQYRVRDGAHTWPYWRTGLTAGLKFIGESFHR